MEDVGLENTWVLWEHQKNSNMNYEQNTCELGTFDNIPDFWRYYNNYPYPSVIFYDGSEKPIIINPDRKVASISLFKKGVEPKWEDVQNTNGAEIAIRKFKSLEELDRLWETISMLCIGEQIESSRYITGIRVVDSSIPNRKALYKIELWFSDKNKRNSIEDSFKSLLKLDLSDQLYYKEHSTAVESVPKYNNNNNKNKNKNNNKYNSTKLFRNRNR
mgnify:CR=1 FL=1